jgi:hypothetical protein
MAMINTKKHTLFVLLLTLALASCTRSASTLPVVEVTEDSIESIFSTVATQTALAALGGQGGGEGDDALAPADTATATTFVTVTPIPTATNTPAPTSEVGVPSSYTLHEGEWPYCLARRFDIEGDALIDANGLTEDQAAELSVGTTLNIPAGAPAFGGQRSLRSHPTTYAASGIDTLYSIACQFGDVWPEHIAEANGVELDYLPTGGEQLHIP